MRYIAYGGTYNEQVFDTDTRTITWTQPCVDKEGVFTPTVVEVKPVLTATYKGRKIWRKCND